MNSSLEELIALSTKQKPTKTPSKKAAKNKPASRKLDMNRQSASTIQIKLRNEHALTKKKLSSPAPKKFSVVQKTKPSDVLITVPNITSSATTLSKRFNEINKDIQTAFPCMQNKSKTPIATVHTPIQWTGLASLFSKENILLKLKSRHIWQSFFDIYKYDTPTSLQEAKRRVEANMANYYFQYSCIIAFSLLITILSYGWKSIFVSVFVVLGFIGISYGWPRKSQAFVLPRPFDSIQISWQAAISIWSFISLLSTLFSGTWTILPTSFGVSTALIGLHAIFHASEPDLSINNQEDNCV